jgi:hypothetical protein
MFCMKAQVALQALPIMCPASTVARGALQALPSVCPASTVAVKVTPIMCTAPMTVALTAQVVGVAKYAPTRSSAMVMVALEVDLS